MATLRKKGPPTPQRAAIERVAAYFALVGLRDDKRLFELTRRVIEDAKRRVTPETMDQLPAVAMRQAQAMVAAWIDGIAARSAQMKRNPNMRGVLLWRLSEHLAEHPESFLQLGEFPLTLEVGIEGKPVYAVPKRAERAMPRQNLGRPPRMLSTTWYQRLVWGARGWFDSLFAAPPADTEKP